MSPGQADRLEQKLNALCQAVGGPVLAKLDLSEPGRTNDLALARVRVYADTLSRSQVPSERSHGATLLEILDREH